MVKAIKTAPSKNPNVRQRATGITETALARGLVQFKSLKAKHHKELLKKEMQYREIVFGDKIKWQDIQKKLKEHEKKSGVWPPESNEPFAFEPLTQYFKDFLKAENPK